MTPTPDKTRQQAHEQLLQYACTVDAMHKSLHKIFTNKKAICESLSRTAAALRTISASSRPPISLGRE